MKVNQVINTLRLQLIKASLKLLSYRPRTVKIKGVDLSFDNSVSHPKPLPFLHFFRLFDHSIQQVSAKQNVLEMGAGAGVWSMMSLQRGAYVTASDLPTVSLRGLQDSAIQADFQHLNVCYGDLFENIKPQLFDHIFFNPPFHFATPKKKWEKAYFGGSEGEVIHHFLAQVPQYISPTSTVWLIIPKQEYHHYQHALQPFWVDITAQQFMLLLGSVYLLRLQIKQETHIPYQLPMSSTGEVFYHLAKMMNTHSCELISFKKNLQVDVVQKAIQHLPRLHPWLSARLRVGSYRRPYWHFAQSTETLQVDVISVGSAQMDAIRTDQRWQGPLPHRLLSYIWNTHPIQAEHECVVRFYLVQEYDRDPTQAHQSHLMLVAPHLATDARAGTRVMADLARLYTHVSQNSLGLHSMTDLPIDRSLDFASQHIQQKSPLDVLHLPLYKRAYYTGKAITRLLYDLCTPAQGFPLKKTTAKRGMTGVYIHEVAGDEMKDILRYARQHQLTAHCIFTWALVQTAKRWSQLHHLPLKKRIRIADLFNLMPWIEKESFPDALHRFEMLVQPYTMTLHTDWNQQTGLYTIKKRLDQLKKGAILSELMRVKLYNFLARYVPLDWTANWVFRYVLKTNITTTNPGRVPFADTLTHWDDIEVGDFINFPQIAPPARLGIIYTTFRQRLRIIILHDQNILSQEETAVLANILRQEIHKIITTSMNKISSNHIE